MKNLYKLSVVFFMTFALGVRAQIQENKWALSFGTNAVDTRTSAGGSNKISDNTLSQFLNVSENWNILPAVTYVGLSRSIANNFSVGLQGSVNRIDKFAVLDRANSKANSRGIVVIEPSKTSYYSIDAQLRYSFMSLIKSKKIDPSLRLGAGYTWIGDNNSASLNFGPGLTYWFTNTFGLELQSTYKAPGVFGAERNITANINAPDMPNHFQHTLGLVIKFGGKDTDGDGINDKNDACPDVPGLKQFNGCPDTDGDGIVDGSDDCPNEFGLATLNGCPDKDGDGIADKNDDCPEIAGLSNLKGCPDSDKDGIADKDDKCPNEAGTKLNGGCPIVDTDNDGVPDSQDDCPTVAGISNNKGCPEVVAVESIQTLLAAGKLVFFNTGEATFKVNDGETIENLDKIFNVIKIYPNTVFTIEGHTDSDGTEEFNQKLSEDRANAVRNAMIEKGVNPNNLTSKGYGETKPIATNKTKAGKAKNRRTEVKP